MILVYLPPHPPALQPLATNISSIGLVRIRDGEAVRMKNFDALKKKMAKIDPQGSGATTDARLSECPAVGSNWQASASLPPTPDKSLCDCMVRSLECVPKQNLAKDAYGGIFDFICSKNKALCAGISGNTTTGVFGSYGMCDDSAKLAFVMDAYYRQQQSGASACDFDGAAKVQKADVDGKCKGMLTEAKKVNEQAATATVAAPHTTSTKDNISAKLSVGLFPFLCILTFLL